MPVIRALIGAERQLAEREKVASTRRGDEARLSNPGSTSTKSFESGDVSANRELRENHAFYYGGTGADIWELLTREQRAQVRAWLEEGAA
jgi:hypothetical protein